MAKALAPLPWRTCILVFAVALIFRLGLVAGFDLIHDFPRKEMVKTAMAFAARGELADPYAVPSGPTAVVPPIYPIYLGLIFRAFGTGAEAEIVKCVLTSLVSALRCALLPWLAIALGLSLRTGAIAGLLSAFYVGALATDVKGDWAEAYAATALVLLFLAAYRLAGAPRLDFGRAALLGLWWGLTLLLSPNFLTILGGFVLLGALRFLREAPVRYLQFLAVLGLVMAAVIAPWPLRNQRVLGKPIWAKGNFGIMLADSYHDGAGWGVQNNDDYIQATSPTRQASEALKVRAMGEVAYDDARKAPAVEWMRAHPGEVVRLMALHARAFWFPPGLNLAHTAVEWGFTIVAVCGLYLLYRRNRVSALLILSIWLFYPPVYYVMVWSSRYRYPINWTLLLTAALALDFAWDRFSPGRSLGARGVL
ncbi:MAG: hypothetical protein ABI759_06790 [Candidatus Solibacter sp.]